VTRWTALFVCFASIALLSACGARRRVTMITPSQIDPTDVHMEGDHVTIDEHIRFAVNSDEILDESSTILDHLAQFIANHQADFASLRIIGHADSQGDRDHNQRLSERRANAVRAALQERGIDLRLDASGRGIDERLCSEETEECHERNRRVEFVIVRRAQ
jgi:OOP family OmpA-OmpF porin